ncbi:MAG TPA: ABC transporter ATP-binding protein [Mycobacteriales bacterium]|nr:ABC transporter ATP-binding protein [Mycobacteriales bacterium]
MAVIEVRDLRKRYGQRPALDGVSFQVEAGEIFGIVGPNGAGKTTAVECLAGLRQPDSGQIRVLGLDPQVDRTQIRQRVGVQLQETQLADQIKVWEALDMYASFYPKPRDWRELLAQWGLADHRNARFSTLSGGQKQRLFIALALVGDPEVAVLDELTTGLDPQARRATWEVVRQVRASGVTVVLVSHFMDEVERLCDRVAVFDGGRIVATDTPAGLVATTESEQQLRFRPMAPLDETMLAGLPGVRTVVRAGEQVVITGVGEFADAVTGALAQQQVLVANLRIDQPTLDDAYLALTGHPGRADLPAGRPENEPTEPGGEPVARVETEGVNR